MCVRDETRRPRRGEADSPDKKSEPQAASLRALIVGSRLMRVQISRLAADKQPATQAAGEKANDTSDGAQEGGDAGWAEVGRGAARVLATKLRVCGLWTWPLLVCLWSRVEGEEGRSEAARDAREVDHPQDSAERWDLSEINWLPARPSRYRAPARGCASGSPPIARYPPRAGLAPVWGGRVLCGATLPLHGPQVTLTWTPVPTLRLRQVT